MRIAGGVGGAEAAVLTHAADIAGGAALGVVDLAVKQTDHRGHPYNSIHIYDLCYMPISKRTMQ